MRLLALPLVPTGTLLVGYGAWLLVGDDYDGGRTPVGALSLAVGVAVLLVSAGLLRRKRH